MECEKSLAMQEGKRKMGGNTYYFMVRDQIIASLKDYPKTKRRLSILQFEYCHRHILTETEMINAMALAPRSADSEGSQTGTFSDNTMYIALHFQERRELLNHETLNEITREITILEAKVKKIEFYVSQLQKQQAEVIRCHYFEGIAWTDLQKTLHVSSRALLKRRDAAIHELVNMYIYLKSVTKEDISIHEKKEL